MDIIEKAGGPARPRKSLVERAAEKLTGAQPAAASIPSPVPPPVSAPTVPPVAAQRVDSPPPLEAHGTTPAIAPAREARITRRQVTLELARLRNRGYVVPGVTSPVAEEFRIIKRQLLKNIGNATNGSRRNNLIMVTSALPGEGKTFSAINLAMSLASEHDMHVLLIDADVGNPMVPSELGFESDTGLIDLLMDERLDMADVLVRTDVPNLSVLPAGRDVPHANELVASTKMARFMNDVAQRYPDRVVILDTAPVLARTETSVLATHVGQIAFVVEAERTSRAAIKEAIDMVGGCKIGGVVLNKMRASYAADRFGHYYGYYKS